MYKAKNAPTKTVKDLLFVDVETTGLDDSRHEFRGGGDTNVFRGLTVILV